MVDQNPGAVYKIKYRWQHKILSKAYQCTFQSYFLILWKAYPAQYAGWLHVIQKSLTRPWPATQTLSWSGIHAKEIPLVCSITLEFVHRPPLSRLISAYRDRVATMKFPPQVLSWFWSILHQYSIYQFYTDLAKTLNLKRRDTERPTWPEFIAYLLTTKRSTDVSAWDRCFDSLWPPSPVVRIPTGAGTANSAPRAWPTSPTSSTLSSLERRSGCRCCF